MIKSSPFHFTTDALSVKWEEKIPTTLGTQKKVNLTSLLTLLDLYCSSMEIFLSNPVGVHELQKFDS